MCNLHVTIVLYPLAPFVPRANTIPQFNKSSSFSVFLFLRRFLARTRNRDQNDAQRQEIGNANVARSRRHEPGNWCFSNPRATTVLTLPARIRNVVDPSRRLAGSEILSKYSSSPRLLLHPRMTSLLERRIWLRTSVLSIVVGGSLLSFTQINPPFSCSQITHPSILVPFFLSVAYLFHQRGIFISDGNASYRHVL